MPHDDFVVGLFTINIALLQPVRDLRRNIPGCDALLLAGTIRGPRGGQHAGLSSFKSTFAPRE